MQINPWLAISVGLTLQALCVPIAFSIPETLAWNAESEALHRNVHDKELSPNMGETIHSIIRAGRLALHDFKIIWTNWQFIFLIGLCPFRIMMGALSDLLQRYVSNRYGWTLANSTFLSSFQGMVSSLVLFLLLPYVTDRLEKKFDLSAVQKNVVISRISLCLLALGYTIQGLAPTVSLLILGLLTESLGLGLGPALRALTGALIERQYNARMYSLIAITETWARMLVYPTVSFIFNAGLEKGGIWLGLQFDITAAIALLALVPMCMLKFESRGITRAQTDLVG